MPASSVPWPRGSGSLSRPAVALVLFAYGVEELAGEATEWLHGLKVVAVAVVVLALWGMGKTLAPDRSRVTIAVLATAALLFTDGVLIQLAVITGGAILGLTFLRPTTPAQSPPPDKQTGAGVGALVLVVFLGFLIALPVAKPSPRQLPPLRRR